MKRRLTIARSLVNRPDLLLLDEPTTGLDPQARHVLWDRLFRLKQEGVTLVITTHYMDEAEQLCDRLVVMDKGLIVAEGSPLALIRTHSTREVAELRFGVADGRADPRRAGREGRRPRRAGRGAARPAAGLHRRRRRGPRQGARARPAPGRHPGAPLHASRTSSCASPAGRWSTDGDPGHRTRAGTPAAGDLTLREGVAPPGRLLDDRLPAHLEGLGRLLLPLPAPLRPGDGRAARRLHRGRPRHRSRARRPTSPSSCPA